MSRKSVQLESETCTSGPDHPHRSRWGGLISEEIALTPTFALRFRDYADEPGRKKLYNEQLFSEVAPKYDFVTKALSLGRDAAWKKHLVETLPKKNTAPRCVDLACGTGDVSLLLADRYPNGSVTGIDLTASMLELAKQRKTPRNLTYMQGDMCHTGIESGSVDIVTGSYALRNAPDLDQAILEIKRILKPGGTAAFLDFSKPSLRLLQAAEYWLLTFWGSFWGVILHRNREVYAYIAESLAAFPDRTRLRECVTNHGFTVTTSRRFYFGVLEMIVLGIQGTARP